MSGTTKAAIAACLPLALLLSLLGLTVLGAEAQRAQTACGGNGPSVIVDPNTLPVGPVAGRWFGAQIENAAAIVNAGALLDVGSRGQTIGVMTAMGESSHHVLDRGDAAGPDSRGLFQQRANGAWGTYADRMNPHTSATNFFRALQAVDGWQTLPPTIAAHRVQRNANPHYYTTFWDDAVTMLTALTNSGVQLVGLAPGAGGQACALTPGLVSTAGWTRPAIGRVASRYGYRIHPISGDRRLHTGTDIAATANTPIYAAATGIVVRAGPAGGYGNLIVIDHGSGVVTRYAHMYAQGILVAIGSPVQAGQQIGLIGSAGQSTGPHLHYEIQIGGQFTDPEPFMTCRGAPLTGTTT